MESAGASTHGTRSSIPSDRRDVERLCAIMVEDGILIKTRGRVARYLNVGDQRVEVRRDGGPDIFGDGFTKLRDGFQSSFVSLD